jgi:hypothetical protein
MFDMINVAASISKSLDKMEETSKHSVELLRQIKEQLETINLGLVELLRETTNG